MTKIICTENHKFEIEFTNAWDDPRNKYYLPFTGNGLEYYGLLLEAVRTITDLDNCWDRNKDESPWELYIPFMPKCVHLGDISGWCDCNLIIKILDYEDAGLLEYSKTQYPSGEYETTNYLGFNAEVAENILPNWALYLPEDSAVLFLTEADQKRCRVPHNTSIGYNYCYYRHSDIGILELEGCKVKILNYKVTSIILSELYQGSLQEIINIAKELKEQHGVERVELFVTHCFLENVLIERYLKEFVLDIDHALAICESKTGYKTKYCIDKITTSNSTSILEVQESERLRVIDSLEFFKHHYE